ncbi:hypothetical protein ACFQZ4_28775 [Catellatospora coxensis]|uniref:CYTH domain-containing protein n=1 Tax=Catellatospora coxensis TaxID=310354 RepID=A0A8J3L5M4_9ACTN|nr:hypothetical protein [Catellatospora coxensis]GIG06855.1 hypothetical protein Cco03nite_35550 [Catellatospora coxensis]
MPETEINFVGTADPKASATAIGRQLGLDFAERESLFLGDRYLRATPPWGEVIIQRNDDMGEPAEPSHPEAPTVVRIHVDAAHESRIGTALRRLGFTQVAS